MNIQKRTDILFWKKFHEKSIDPQLKNYYIVLSTVLQTLPKLNEEKNVKLFVYNNPLEPKSP